MEAMHALEFVPSLPLIEGPTLRLYVIHTTPDATRASLNVAGLLARDLAAAVELLVPQVVPYPVPLQDPTVSASFTEASASRLAAACDAEVSIKVLLCRDREETVPKWLPPDAIAIIGRRRRWGPGSSRKLIRVVKAMMRHVIVVETGKSQPTHAPMCRRQNR